MADENETLVDGKALSSLRVVDLKQELKKRGLKTNGTKAYLQNLLKVYIESENASNDNSGNANDDHNQNSVKQNQSSNTLSSNLDESSEHEDSNIAINEKNESSVDEGSNLVVNDGNDGDDNKSDKTEEDIDMSETNEEKRNTNPEFTVFASEESASNSDINNLKDNSTTGETHTESSETSQNTNAFKEISQNLTENENIEELPEDGVNKLERSEEIKSDNVEREPERENERELNESEAETHKIELTSDETVSQIVNNDNINTNVNPESEQSNKISETESKVETTNEQSDEVFDENKESKPTDEVFDENKESKPTDEVFDENKESQPTIIAKLESSDVSSNANPETEAAVESVKELRHSSDGRERRPPRKRRWGSTTAQDIHNTNKGISSDQLKELIPDLNNTVTSSNNTNTNTNIGNIGINSNSVNTITVKVSNKYDMNVNVSSNTNKSQTSITNNENPSKRDIRVVRKSVSVSEENNTDSRKASSINVETIKPNAIAIAMEAENESKMYATKSAESNIIFIRNLVRPFTLLQLKDVLGKTGRINEQQFWIDKIKSKCYVTYETVAEAVATRQALHGTRWPASNPKLLSVDFSTKDELDYHLNLENSSNKEVVINNKTDQNQNNNEKYDILIKTDRDVKIIRENEDIIKEKEKPEIDKNKLENRPIREWDREKLVNNDEKERSRTASKRRPTSPTQKNRPQDVSEIKRRRHDSTKGGERNRVSAEKNVAISAQQQQQQEPESPAKLLDDLFKKTSATPSIYWLPLTEEQAVARDTKRAEIDKKRKEEREARDEAFRKRQEEMTADRRERENEPPIRNERGPNMRSNSPPNRRFNSPPNRRPNMPPRRPSPYRRASPRRSPNRRSPPRHPANARASRSPINRRMSPRRRR